MFQYSHFGMLAQLRSYLARLFCVWTEPELQCMLLKLKRLTFSFTWLSKRTLLITNISMLRIIFIFLPIHFAFPELRLLGELYNDFDTFWDNLARGESPLAALLNFENRNYKLRILRMC